MFWDKWAEFQAPPRFNMFSWKGLFYPKCQIWVKLGTPWLNQGTDIPNS